MFATLTLVASLTSQVTPLEVARAQVEALKFREAAKTLAQVELEADLTRAEVIELSMLEGLVRGTLNDNTGARTAFSRALVLEPDLKLQAHAAPRVTTPFFEAKGRVRELGRLEVSLVKTERTEKGWSLSFALSADPLGLVDEVEFGIEEDGVARTERQSVSKLAPVVLTGARAQVRWTLRGKRNWLLQDAPAVVFTPPPPPAPVVSAVPPVVSGVPPLVPPVAGGITLSNSAASKTHRLLELQEEHERLERAMPSRAGPILLIVASVPTGAIALFLPNVLFYGELALEIAFSIGMGVVAIAALVVGIIWVVAQSRAANAVDARLRAIELELKAVDLGLSPPVSTAGPDPSVLVATF